MDCYHCREIADRYAAAADEERSSLHKHMADCSECRGYFDGFQRTTRAFERLGEIDGREARQRIRSDLSRRAGLARRQSIWAGVGALIAALAAFWFIAKGDPFGYFALLGTSIVMGWTLWRSRRQARAFAASCEDAQMLSRWRADVVEQLKQVGVVGPLIAAGFAILSTIVVVRFGVVSLRGLLYGLTCIAIVAYVVRQWLVVRPQLQAELTVMDEEDSSRA